MGHLYKLVEAVESMLANQEKTFVDRCAQNEILTYRNYCGKDNEYLGDLCDQFLSIGLEHITRERRKMMTHIPSGQNACPTSLGACDSDYTVSYELGVPYQHTLYEKLQQGMRLTKWDVHPRWHLRESTSRDPYRRILDPKIVAVRRGRPRNNAQPNSSGLFNPVGRRSTNTLDQSQQSAVSVHPQGEPSSQLVRRCGRLPGSKNKRNLADL